MEKTIRISEDDFKNRQKWIDFVSSLDDPLRENSLTDANSIIVTIETDAIEFDS